MRVWAAMIMLGVGSYSMRASFISAVGAKPLSETVEATLRNVGPAVMGALVASLLTAGDTAPFGLAEASGLGVTSVLAWKTRSFLWAFLSGTAVWVCLRLLG